MTICWFLTQVEQKRLVSEETKTGEPGRWIAWAYCTTAGASCDAAIGGSVI